MNPPSTQCRGQVNLGFQVGSELHEPQEGRAHGDLGQAVSIVTSGTTVHFLYFYSLFVFDRRLSRLVVHHMQYRHPHCNILVLHSERFHVLSTGTKTE